MTKRKLSTRRKVDLEGSRLPLRRGQGPVSSLTRSSRRVRSQPSRRAQKFPLRVLRSATHMSHAQNPLVARLHMSRRLTAYRKRLLRRISHLRSTHISRLWRPAMRTNHRRSARTRLRRPPLHISRRSRDCPCRSHAPRTASPQPRWDTRPLKRLLVALHPRAQPHTAHLQERDQHRPTTRLQGRRPTSPPRDPHMNPFNPSTMPRLKTIHLVADPTRSGACPVPRLVTLANSCWCFPRTRKIVMPTNQAPLAMASRRQAGQCGCET